MSLFIIPPKNSQGPNLYDAYNQMMSGNIAAGRSTIAKFYQDGTENPRAKLYETMIERRNIREFGTKCLSTMESYTPETKRMHNQAVNELFFSKHPLVENAYKQLHENLAKIYPNKKTQRLTRFVLGKTLFPIFDKFKCMIKFMK